MENKSKDGSGNWEIIDRNNTEALSEPGKWKAFECDKQSEVFYSDVRIRQLENSMGYDTLSLGGIDIIGKWEQLVIDCSYQGKPFGGIVSFILREYMNVRVSKSSSLTPMRQRFFSIGP